MGFAQPQQVEALQGGFGEEALWELALVLAVLLQSLCGESHGQGGVVWRLEACR